MSAYDDYSIEISPKVAPIGVWTEPRGVDVLRVHYRVFRIPSEKRFVVHRFRDANAEDDAYLESSIARGVIAASWRGGEKSGAGYRRIRRSNGTYSFRGHFGRLLDDPMMQLELEMMLDTSHGTHTRI